MLARHVSLEPIAIGSLLKHFCYSTTPTVIWQCCMLTTRSVTGTRASGS